MNGRRFQKPERADYFRFFPALFLTDENTEGLSAAEIGALVLLYAHAWTKGGHLPNNPERLARYARISEGELTALLAKGPALISCATMDPPGPADRVTFAWLWGEWNAVRNFYSAQAAKSQKAHPTGTPRTIHGQPVGDPTYLLTYKQTNKEKKGTRARDPEAPPPPAPPPAPDFSSPKANGEIQFPTLEGGTWSPTPAQVDEWSATFPALDVVGVLKKLAAKFHAGNLAPRPAADTAPYVLALLGKERPLEPGARPATPSPPAEYRPPPSPRAQAIRDKESELKIARAVGYGPEIIAGIEQELAGLRGAP